METGFKVGMKVYDQLMFPDKEGIVLTINYKPENFFNEDVFDENYVHPYPIEVEFGSETMLYTSDGNSGLMGFPTLSTKPYKVELQGFEQKATITTYEEAVEWVKKNSKNRVVYADEIYINEENEEAFENLKKLVILREYYNEGWKADWNNDRITKWTIEVSNNSLNVTNEISFSRPLYFKTELLAEKFLEEQRDLLEKAKPLL